ncbi:hypothetical protein [Occallatibacter savannae]|uniref:hypothetical protein n=1 Tax=Occallatibacter savannae TaxID=1002691 RepID=UPI000D686196|nr:hypothetical protein [Occallatibacter savannae]
MGLSFAISAVMLALCLAFAANSQQRFPVLNHPAVHPGHDKHAPPWLKVMVGRAISLAGYLGA